MTRQEFKSSEEDFHLDHAEALDDGWFIIRDEDHGEVHVAPDQALPLAQFLADFCEENRKAARDALRWLGLDPLPDGDPDIVAYLERIGVVLTPWQAASVTRLSHRMRESGERNV